MPSQMPSFFRQGSGQMLAGCALLGAVLFMARLHVLAAVCTLVAVALAGALRRFQEQASIESRSIAETLPVAPVAQARSVFASREALEASIDSEWERDQTVVEPLALLLIAVDAFDQMSERGEAGWADVAMLTIGSALARMLPRAADMLARYDESTFAVLLRSTDLPGSLRVAARLRWSIVRLGLADPSVDEGLLTASMGVVVQYGLAPGGTRGMLQAAESSLSRAQLIGPDSLEYAQIGEERHPANLLAQVPVAIASRPAIRAWTTEQAPALHSPQS